VFRLSTAVFGFASEYLHDLGHWGGFLADRHGDRGLYATTPSGELAASINRGEPFIPDQNLRLEVAVLKKILAQTSLSSDPKIIELVRNRFATGTTFRYSGIQASGEALYPNLDTWVDAVARMTAAGAMIAHEIRAEARDPRQDDPAETFDFYKRCCPAVMEIDVAERYPRYYDWLKRELGAILLQPAQSP
jgi:hypothetical protein